MLYEKWKWRRWKFSSLFFHFNFSFFSKNSIRFRTHSWLSVDQWRNGENPLRIKEVMKKYANPANTLWTDYIYIYKFRTINILIPIVILFDRLAKKIIQRRDVSKGWWVGSLINVNLKFVNLTLSCYGS